MAACAVGRSTPSISNRIFPGRITATHWSGAPDRKSTRLNSSHTDIYTLSLHDALPILSRQPHGGVRRRPVHAFHLEQDFSGTDHRHPLVRSPLALAHARFGGLLGDRLVREQPDPHLSPALDGARHGHARGFDLPVGDPRALHRLESEIAEGDGGPAPRLAGHAPALLLPVLDLLWHHHGGSSSILTGSRPKAQAGRSGPASPRVAPGVPAALPAGPPVSRPAASATSTAAKWAWRHAPRVAASRPAASAWPGRSPRGPER